MSKVGRPPEPWKKTQIIETASDVLSERGLQATGVKDLADAAGVSRAAIHYHFGGVDGVVLGIAERGFELMYTRRRVAIQALESATSRLVTLIRMGIPDPAPNHYVLMYESIGAVRNNPDFRPLFESFSRRQYELFEGVLLDGVASGDFHPRESIETISWNLLSIEDAAGIYITIGTAPAADEVRARMISYAASSLDCDLSTENDRQRARTAN
ncbi:MAG: TetR/AcrR family transcriptional regulator [Acidimicrobiia bacterium]|nr:TetR/AcrR family transcriptional regulator [Acidimicrobiia bacterium]